MNARRALGQIFEKEGVDSLEESQKVIILTNAFIWLANEMVKHAREQGDLTGAIEIRVEMRPAYADAPPPEAEKKGGDVE